MVRNGHNQIVLLCANQNNVKEYINMFKRSDVYRRALVSGMGYSSRVETEAFTPKNLKEKVTR